MRKLLVVAGAFAALAGCVPEPKLLVHKDGSLYAERQKATLDCSVEGIQKVPRAMATQTSSGYYSPGTTYCNTIGTTVSCNQVGAVNIPASSVTYDANQGLRDQVVAACLHGRGYSVLPRPQCTSDRDKQVFMASRQGPQPPASQIPCVL